MQNYKYISDIFKLCRSALHLHALPFFAFSRLFHSLLESFSSRPFVSLLTFQVISPNPTVSSLQSLSLSSLGFPCIRSLLAKFSELQHIV